MEYVFHYYFKKNEFSKEIVSANNLKSLCDKIISELSKISEDNNKYKNIISESRTNDFSKKDSDLKYEHINYYKNSFSSDEDYINSIKNLLEIIKYNFSKENIDFEYKLEPIELFKDDVSKNSLIFENKNVLYFGSPGTGKSYEIEQSIKNKKQFRAVFYDGYDYCDFFGQFKPVSSEKDSEFGYYNTSGALVENKEPVVLFEFTPGVFINAYVEAKQNPNEDVFLIIEEINRGNCAEIFGDVFQLLDRKSDGSSEYSINVSSDLKKYLKLNNLCDVDTLSLPKNLFIIGTMNTSDQSLYPIDSAFKRRWDLKYIPINYNEFNLKQVRIEGSEIYWLDFLKKINAKIEDLLESEDKTIGQWFVKPKDGKITINSFKNKVLHYLFYDVFEHNLQDVFKTNKFSDLHNKDIDILLKIIIGNK